MSLCVRCSKDPVKLAAAQRDLEDSDRREAMLLSRIRGVLAAWRRSWVYDWRRS